MEELNKIKVVEYDSVLPDNSRQEAILQKQASQNDNLVNSKKSLENQSLLDNTSNFYNDLNRQYFNQLHVMYAFYTQMYNVMTTPSHSLPFWGNYNSSGLKG